MGGLSLAHWIVVIGVIVLLFGSSKIAAMMGDLGKSVKETRKVLDEIEEK